MVAYIIKRLVSVVVTLLGITVVVFAIGRFAPGDPTVPAAGPAGQINADNTQGSHRVRIELYGLDRPMYMQYAHWLGRVVLLDFGDSIKHHRPVIDLIAERLPITLILNLTAFTIIYSFSVPVGILTAVKHGRCFDRLTSIVLLGMWSLPIMWVGQMLVGYLTGPAAAGLDGSIPWSAYSGAVLCLTYTGFAYLTRQVRASVLENLHADYVRTARAKGLSETAVLLGHVLPNSLIPLATISATLLPALISGSVIVEKIFGIPGMGLLMFEAVTNRDYNVVMAVVTIAGALNSVGLLLADIVYAAIDPRVDFGSI